MSADPFVPNTGPDAIDLSQLKENLGSDEHSQAYFKSVNKAAVEDDIGLWDYGRAFGSGMYVGATQQAPMMGLGALRLAGLATGADSVVEWADSQINDFKQMASENPGLVDRDPRFGDSYFARTLQDGASSMTSSLLYALPAAVAGKFVGPAVGMAAGIQKAVTWLAGSAGVSGVAGMAAADTFLDDMYTEAKKKKPDVTREEIYDRDFVAAMETGISEAGTEFAGDVLMGKLLGLFGRGLAPAAGTTKEAFEASIRANALSFKNIIRNGFKNVTRGVLTEMPSEMANAAWQEQIRIDNGLDSDGVVAAIRKVMGPSALAGGLIGGAGTPFGMANTKQQAQQGYEQVTEAEADAKAALQTPEMAKLELGGLVTQLEAARIQDVIGPAGASYMGMFEDLDPSARGAVGLALFSRIGKAASETGRPTNELWEELGKTGPNDPYVRSVSNTVVNMTKPTHTYDSFIRESMGVVLRGASQDNQNAVTQAFTNPDGTVDSEGMLDSFRGFMDNPDSVTDPALKAGFEDMKAVLKTSFDGVQNSESKLSNRGKIPTELRVALESRLGPVEATPVPDMSNVPLFQYATNGTELDKAILDVVKDGKNNANINNQLLAREFVKHTNFNFNPMQLADNPTAQGIIAKMEESLKPILDPILAKRPDLLRNEAAEAAVAKGEFDATSIDKIFNAQVANSEGTYSEQLAKGILYQTILMEQLTKVADEYLAHPSDSKAVELQMLRAVNTQVWAEMRGIRAEAGRGLRAWRDSFRGGRFNTQQMAKLLEESGGTTSAAGFAQVLQNVKAMRDNGDLSTGLTPEKVLNQTMDAKTLDMFVTYVTLGLFSNPATQVVNLGGNMGLMAWKTTMRALGTALNDPTPGGLIAGETGALLNGYLKGLVNVAKVFGDYQQDLGGWGVGTAKALYNPEGMDWGRVGRNGQVLDDVGALPMNQFAKRNVQGVIDHYGAMANESMGNPLSKERGVGKALHVASEGLSTMIGIFGEGYGIISKGLFTGDQLFKSMLIQGELNARAHRRAYWDSQRPGAPTFDKLFEYYTQNPHKDDLEGAQKFALFGTLQNNLGALGSSIQTVRRDVPLTRLLVPVLKTTVNSFKYTLTATPVANQFVKEFRAELNSPDPATKQLAESRVMLGTLFYTAALGMAANGFITGMGPPNPEDKERKMRTGYQPNSFHIGDNYYDYSRLEPMAMALSLAASSYEMFSTLDDEDDLNAVRAYASAMFTQTITNRTMLRSLTQTLNAIMDPGGSRGQRAFNQLMVNLTPFSSLTRASQKTYDPWARETDTLLNTFKAHYGLDAPRRYDILGDPIMDQQTVGSPWFSPFNISRDKHNVIHDEVNRLTEAGFRTLAMPDRSLVKDGVSIKMSGQQYQDYIYHRARETYVDGRNFVETLNDTLQNEVYKSSNNEEKKRIFDRINRKFTAESKPGFLRKHPEAQRMLEKLATRKENRANGN